MDSVGSDLPNWLRNEVDDGCSPAFDGRGRGDWGITNLTMSSRRVEAPDDMRNHTSGLITSLKYEDMLKARSTTDVGIDGNPLGFIVPFKHYRYRGSTRADVALTVE